MLQSSQSGTEPPDPPESSEVAGAGDGSRHTSGPSSAKQLTALTWGLAIVATIASTVLLAPAIFGLFRPHLYSGTVLQGEIPAPPLDGLAFADGSPADLTTMQDEVVIMYFGYTNCPDICPGALKTVDVALDQLGDDVENVELVMVSIDTARDNPEELESYLTSFDERFHGASGAEEDVALAASLYGVYYSLGEESQGGYLVDHTASLMAIDPGGSLRVVWPPTVTADELAADIDDLRP